MRWLGWSAYSNQKWRQYSPCICSPTNFLIHMFYIAVPAQEFCYEMKVIQAFSWMLFILYVIALYLTLRLVTEAQRFGRYDIWWAPIQGASYDLPRRMGC